MRLTKMQISAIAGQIIKEKNDEVLRSEEIEAKLDEYKARKADIISYLAGYLENLKEEDKKLLNEVNYNLPYILKNDLSLRNLVKKELGIKKPPSFFEIERLIILETIECDNLNTLIEKVKSKL